MLLTIHVRVCIASELLFMRCSVAIYRAAEFSKRARHGHKLTVCRRRSSSALMRWDIGHRFLQTASSVMRDTLSRLCMQVCLVYLSTITKLIMQSH